MKRWLALVSLLATLVLVIVHAPAAMASATVDITELSLPGEADAKLEKQLRTLLHKAARPLDFGRGKRVEITVKLVELTVEESDDVLRVTCTLVGRLKGGGSARSHISFGGKPKRRKELQRQVLAMVSDGVMSRLAELARTRDALEKKKAADEKSRKDQGGKKPARATAP